MNGYAKPEKSFGIFYKNMKLKNKSDMEIVTQFSVNSHIHLLDALRYLENIVGGNEEIEEKKKEIKGFYGIVGYCYEP